MTAPVIVNSSGKPARDAASQKCPGCGKGPEVRQVVATFGGEPYEACTSCGHEFREEQQ